MTTSTKTDGERLERVEANLENLTQIVTAMSNDVKTIITEQNNARLSNVTRPELASEIAAIRIELESAKKKSAVQTWVTGSLSALFGVLLTLLLTFFFTNIEKL